MAFIKKINYFRGLILAKMLKPQKALNPAYRKHKPFAKDVKHFLKALKACLASIQISDQNGESEEHLKESIKQFFKKSIYHFY